MMGGLAAAACVYTAPRGARNGLVGGTVFIEGPGWVCRLANWTGRRRESTLDGE